MTPGAYYAKFGRKVSSQAVKTSKRRNSAAKRRNVIASAEFNKHYIGRISGPRHNERTMPVGSPDGTCPHIRAAKSAA